MAMGHSRVPVYHQNPLNIIGLVLVKNLLGVDPDEGVPLRKMTIRKIPRVPDSMPLYDILNEFQKGHSHIAVVYKDLNQVNERSMYDHGSSSTGVVIKSDGGQRVKKIPGTTTFKRHRGCSFCILDVENDPVPEFPPNQDVVGVISMEDVIEELLKEEILDETDEYVNIHNRIKVNMNASHEELPGVSSLRPS